MIYRKIDPRLWDDEKIAQLDATTKLVWLYLLTGPHTTGLPGLWHVGIAAIAEGLRIGVEDVMFSIDELQEIGRVEFDAERRLVMVPRSPKYNPADTARTVKAWFAQWKKLPNCPLKYQHIANLEAGICTGKVREEWVATFGKVDVAAGLADSRTNGSKQSLDASEKVSNKVWICSPAPALSLSGSLLPSDPLEASEIAGAPVAAAVPVLEAPAPVAAEPAGPVEAPEDVLAVLRQHKALAPVANLKVAASALGAAMTAGKLGLLALAIAECAEKAQAADDVDATWSAEHMSKTVVAFVKNARPPKARGQPGRGRESRLQPAAPEGKSHWTPQTGDPDF